MIESNFDIIILLRKCYNLTNFLVQEILTYFMRKQHTLSVLVAIKILEEDIHINTYTKEIIE